MLLNIGKYIQIGLFVALCSACLFLYISNNSLKKENKELIEKIANTESILSFQSQQIVQQKLDIEKYKKQQPKIVTKIEKIYEKVYIPKENEDCNIQLKSYNDLLYNFMKNAKEERLH